jgi:hypothetical protein
MNKKIIIAAAVTAIVTGSVVAYAKGSTVTNDTYQPTPAASIIPTASVIPAAPKTVHPLDRGDVKDVNLNIKGGPNRALLAIEPDLVGEIKKMNTSGEYMNKVALVVFLHAMTHQKIKADQIGFSIKMTPEIIEVMLENIKNSKELSDQERADFLSIASNWKAGDFSQADKDHNYFWTLQGGTIGKANGINSAAEETAFVSDRFPNGKQTASER